MIHRLLHIMDQNAFFGAPFVQNGRSSSQVGVPDSFLRINKLSHLSTTKDFTPSIKRLESIKLFGQTVWNLEELLFDQRRAYENSIKKRSAFADHALNSGRS